MSEKHFHIHVHPDAGINSRLEGIEHDLDDVMGALSALLDRQRHFHLQEMHQIDEETNELAASLKEIGDALGPDKQAEIDKIRAATARLLEIAHTPAEPPVTSSASV